MIRRSTEAARRNTEPGTQNARDVIWDSDEREEEEAWKCIFRPPPFLFGAKPTDRRPMGVEPNPVTSHT